MVRASQCQMAMRGRMCRPDLEFLVGRLGGNAAALWVMCREFDAGGSLADVEVVNS